MLFCNVNMDSVIITGASGEPALSIARRLCGIGIRVYALAGTIPENGLSADEFVPVPCDLTSPESVIAAVKKILEAEPHVSGVVLAGQYLSDERFEAVSTEEIALAFNAQTVSPLCAVRLALPSLIAARGHVVVVSPGAGTSAGRALNAASDAAVRAFAGTLFAELRDTGVKTCHILLQGNEGEPDPAARFTTTPQSRIHADIVADAVETVFRLRENNALTQMILRPQATRETPHIPVSAEPKIRALQEILLPPAKNFPPEETPIPTPAYRRPAYAPAKTELPAGERGNDDGTPDDYVDPELRYLLKNPHPQNQERGDGGNAREDDAARQNGGRRDRNRRRRRNRHGGNRAPDGAMRIGAPQFANAPTQENPEKPPEQESPRTAGTTEKSEAETLSPKPDADRPTEAFPRASEENSEGKSVPAGESTTERKPAARKKERRPKSVPAADAENPERKKKPRAPRKRKTPDGNAPQTPAENDAEKTV